MKQPVIYKITNVVNQKFYVGSTYDTRERFRTHRNKLRRGVHHCRHLQAAWNKYGEDCFKFEVVEIIAELGLLQAAEDVWLARWVGQPECYNSGLRSGAPWRGVAKEKHPNFGVAITPEQKQAISATLKAFYAEDYNNHPRVGKKHTPETLAKIAANRTAPAGANHYRYGTTLSAEAREKIGAAQRGVKKAPRVLTPEGHAKILASAAAGNYSHFQGKTHTEESKLKMSRAIVATDAAGIPTTYPSITALREALGLKAPTVNRALKSGKPLVKGPLAGWSFAPADRS